MKYLIATGKIIEGEPPWDSFVSLESSSPLDNRLLVPSFMGAFKLRIKHSYGIDIDSLGHAQMLDELEKVGFLIRLQ